MKKALTEPPTLPQLLDYVEISRDDLLAFEDLARLESQKETTVIISGSLVEGLGNYRSDIDIIVIGEGVRPKAPPETSGSWLHYESCVHYHGKRRVDFAYWQPAALAKLAERLQPPPGKPYGFQSLHEDELKFLHRLKIGHALVNPERFEAVRTGIPFDRLRGYLVHRAQSTTDSILEDVYGMMDDEAFDTALLRAHDLLAATYTLYVHHLGHTNCTSKWALRLLKRHPDDPGARLLLDKFWELFYPDVARLRGDPALAHAHLRQVIETVNQIIEQTQG